MAEQEQQKQKGGFHIPVFQGVLPLDKRRMSPDLVAGVTLAALAIPEVMGYAKIAGMPVITGLYTILIPIALFALFGSSRHLVVGADSATAAIMAAGLVGLATAGSTQYVALAGLLAVITGVILLVARLVRLGFLADFLSRTVLVGFLTGVGTQVAIGQISDMLGIPGGGSGTVQKLVNDLKQLPQTNLATLAVALGVLAIILGMKRITKKVPGALIAVIGMIFLSWALDLQTKGVAVLGTVPGGLPTLGLPSGGWSSISKLLPTAVSLFIVIIAQSAATSRAYSAKYDESLSENVDLVGLTLANVGAGLSGTFVVNGSPTKTQMVDSAGGHSQLSQLMTAVIVLIVLLFLTGPLAYMPEAVLAAVVFLIGIELVDVAGMRQIFAMQKVEFAVALITAAVVVFWGVEQAIILAIVLSLLVHVRRGYKPKNTILARDGAGHLRLFPVSRPAEIVPGLVIYRFNHAMYYANAEQFMQEVLGLMKLGPPPLAWFCLDMSAVDEVDFSAGATIRQVFGQLKKQDVRLVFGESSDDVRTQLNRYQITELVGEGAYFDSIESVIEAYSAQAGVST